MMVKMLIPNHLIEADVRMVLGKRLFCWSEQPVKSALFLMLMNASGTIHRERFPITLLSMQMFQLKCP